jgi:hypothetical protein
MLDKVHDHIVSELGHSSRTDTIFVVTAIVVNLIILGVNSGVSAAAADSRDSTVTDLVLVAFMAMTLVLNVIAVVALQLGRRTRGKLLSGLTLMYRDNAVEKYHDSSLISDYGKRYLLFTGIIVTLALTALVVPLIIRWWM